MRDSPRRERRARRSPGGRESIDWSPARRPCPGRGPRPSRPDVRPRLQPTRLRRPGARPAPGVGGPAHVRAAPGAERGRPALELPRRADHRQQPDGRPPRLGPHVQGPVPALPRDAGRGPAVPERVRLPGPVGRGQRRARPGLHVQARHRGVRHRGVRQPVQAAGAHLRRPPDRAEHPARLLDGLERPGRAAPAARPAGGRPGAAGDDRGPGGPRDGHGRDGRRAARHARRRRQLLHLQQREQRPHLGVPGRVPQARLDLPRPRHDAVVPALRHRPVPDGDERGLPGSRGPGAHRAVPAPGPAGRVAARLDDDAMDAGRQRGRGRRPGPALRQGPAGRGPVLAQPRDAQAGPPGPVPGRRGGRRRGPRRLALRRPVRRPAGGSRRVRRGRLRAPRGRVERRRRGGGDRHRPHRPGLRRGGLPARADPRAAGHRPDRRGRSLLPELRLAQRARGAGGHRGDHRRPRAAVVLLPPRGRTATATRTAGGAGRRCCSGSSTSGTSAWARSTTSRARR